MKKILVLLLVLSLLSVFSCSTTDNTVKGENISQSVSDEVSVPTPEDVSEEENSSEESEEILSPDALSPADEAVDNDGLEPPLSNPKGVGEDGESRELPPEVAPQSSENIPPDGTNAPAPDDSHLPGDVPAPSEEQTPEEVPEPKLDNVPGDIPAPTGNAPDMEPPRDKENAQTPGEMPLEVETGKRVSSLEIFLVGLCVFIFLLIVILVVIMIRKPGWYRKKYDRED